MNEMKRVLALLLCFVMLVGVLPVGALAADVDATAPVVVLAPQTAGEEAVEGENAVPTETTEGTVPVEEKMIEGIADVDNTRVDAALFFSDLHTTSTKSKSDVISNIMVGVKKSGLDFSTVTSVGDVFSSNSSVNGYGKLSTITSSFETGLNDTDLEIFYAWSDHDRGKNSDGSGAGIANFTGLFYGAGNNGLEDTSDDAEYYIYTISMAQMSTPEDDRYSTNVFTKTDDLQPYLTAFTNTVNALDHSKPLFIASHLPLLDNRDDNGNAYKWWEVINEAAKTMDIVFLYGHNHNHVDSAKEYYYGKGETMSVCTSASGSSKNVTLNFTHICAGFMDPSTTGNQNSLTRQGTVVVADIGAKDIRLTTYDKNGVHTGTYATDVTVPRAYAVEEKPQEPEVTIPEYAEVSCDAGSYIDGVFTPNADSVLAAGRGLTAVTAVWNDADVSEFIDGVVYDVALEGFYDAATIRMEVAELNAAELKLYFQAADGTWTESTAFTAEATELGVAVVFEAPADAFTVALGNPVEEAPAAAVVTGLTISGPAVKNYFLSEDLENGEVYLDITGLTVTAVYDDGFTKTLEWDRFGEETGYSLNFGDLETPGEKTVTVSYTEDGKTVTAQFTVFVCQTDMYDETTGTSITFDTPSVIGVDVTVSEANETVAAALEGKISGKATVYNIKPQYATGMNQLQGIATVTLPIPEGIENPVVYYVSDDGAVVADMNAKKSEDGENVVFFTNHFSAFTVAEALGYDLEKPKTATLGSSTTQPKDVYVLVSRIDGAGDYLIVNTNAATGAANLLTATTTGVNNTSAVTVVKGTDANGNSLTYIEDPKSNNAIWTAAASGQGYTLRNAAASRYLRYSSGNLTTGTSSTVWRVADNGLYYRGTTNNSVRYIRYNDGWAMNNNTTAQTIYIYQKQTRNFTVGSSVIYSIAGDPEEATVPALEGNTYQLNAVLSMEHSTGDFENLNVTEDATFTLIGDPSGILSGLNGSEIALTGATGEAVIKVSYSGTDEATNTAYTVDNYIVVTAEVPKYFTLDLHKIEPNPDGEDELIFIEDEEILTFKGIEAGDTAYVWAVIEAHMISGEVVDLGDVPDHRIRWTNDNPSIASVDVTSGEITFTGNVYGTFYLKAEYLSADGQTVLAEDYVLVSVSKNEYIVPGDGTDDFPRYPEKGAIRYDKSSSAVGNFSETGLAKVELSMTGVPFDYSKPMDVVLMLDRSSSMAKADIDRIGFTIEATKAFVKNVATNDDGTFNGNRIIVMDFLGGNLASGSSHKYQMNRYTLDEEKGYQVINNQEEMDALFARIDADFVGQTGLHGTEYAQGLEDCYDALAASRADGNQQFCVFMSDGIPNYFQGETTHFTSTSSFVGMYTVTNRTNANGTATRSSTKYEYEKYSTMMKNEGVTVYTVGLGLKDTNSSWSGTSAEVCEQVADILLNDISGPAYEAIRDTGSTVSKKGTYFFSVADADAASSMADVFTNIANAIKDAATDVEVVDKVGSKYSVNFAIPGLGTDYVLSEDALQGQDEFYVQVVDYMLDPTTHERTGVYSVIEKFSFGLDGKLKNHTVDGASCGTDCDHVEVGTDGSILGLAGTYVTYESNDEGEFLTWNSEKIGTSELALQYIAHLDNSSGVAPEDQVAPDSYYTNDWATLTYTNYNGNRVQQEFPIPQMAWNGAQVTYVFYLVNDEGKPVNQAGQVVPFAEAVYVTKPQTYAVQWNRLEQAAGLEAHYLALEEVPEIYELYDDGANYWIHVYENENVVNLNNHFVIGTTSTNVANPNTTYVYNTKGDPVKYNAPGAYIANDGHTEAKTTYLCKSYSVTDAAFTKEWHEDTQQWVYTVTKATYNKVEGETQILCKDLPSKTGASEVNGYAYYVDEYDQVYTIVQKADGKEVQPKFDFADTTVAFAVLLKPELQPDTVVIDYGLDVEVDVIMNDNKVAKVAGVMETMPAGVTENENGSYNISVGNDSIDVKITENNTSVVIGQASIIANKNTKVLFSLNKDNGMQFTKPAKFYYEAKVDYEKEQMYMASSVTVIPAANVYYEDEYVDLFTYNRNSDGTYTKESGWLQGSTAATGVQATDRPGLNEKMLDGYDANNEYGYDSAYDTSSTYSMGAAAMTTVTPSNYASAEFTFYGTGFDVISMTNSTTGLITVEVQDMQGETVGKILAVDTYYGYTYGMYAATYYFDGIENWYLKSVEKSDATEETTLPDNWGLDHRGDEFTIHKAMWQPAEGDSGSIYQVPVMKISDLKQGTYKAIITAAYSKWFDHVEPDDTKGSYDFYLDAIRIYDPMPLDTKVGENAEGKDITAGDIYASDNEGWAEYTVVRDILVEDKDFDSTTSEETEIPGAIFIDDASNTDYSKTYTIAEYANYGPNNEVYLASGQVIAFTIPMDANIADVQLGLKSANGERAIAALSVGGKALVPAEITNGSSSTDRYYSIMSELKDCGDTAVIALQNASTEADSLLSITNVKVTYKTKPAKSGTFSMNRAAVDMILAMLNAQPEEMTPEVLPEAELEVSINSKSVKEGKQVTAKVTTSGDVDYLMVNGEKVTEFKANKKTGKRTWTVKVTAEEAGEMEIQVGAYTEKDVLLETVTDSVTVTANKNKTEKNVGQLLDKLFG